jgi:hypothetical protein
VTGRGYLQPLSILLLAAGCGGAPGSSGPLPVSGGPAITIDGAFADWSAVAVAAPAPSTPASGSPVGLGPVRLTHDASALYLLLELDREVNLQSMEGTVRLLMDADGDPSTGRTEEGVPGVDLVVDFSHRGEASGAGQGMAVRGVADATWSDVYWIGLLYGPTHASDRFEVRLLREGRGSGGHQGFSGPRVAGRLLVVDTLGTVTHRGEPFSHPLDARPGAPRAAGAAAVARPGGTDLRVLAWNVGTGGILRAPEPYQRILRALGADVLLLDELTPSMDAAGLEAFLEGAEPGAGWSVVVGTGGGRQRTAVASRFPLEPHPLLDRVDYPDSIQELVGLPMSRQLARDLEGAPAEAIPAVGAVTTVRGRSVLLVPVDLFCCGRVGSPDDRGRIMAADAIRGAVARALAAGGIDGVVIGGDLNLVGSRTPLDLLRQGLDPAGGNLVSAATPRLDGASNTTWRNPGPFPPGKLDYLLASPSLFGFVRSFAFDPADLTPAALGELGLLDDDGEVTDHLPVVVDLQLR